MLQHESKRYRLRIIEQCDFIDDHLFTPFGTESYVDRCFANIIRVESPKTAYICKDQVGNEWNYSREILEPCDFAVDAFVIVLDITLTGEAALSQQRFLKRAIIEVRRRKIPFVFASSKHDCAASPENKEFVKYLLHKGSKSLKKIRYCRVETSARLDVNVQQAFLSAALLCSSASSDINCKYFPYSPPPSIFSKSLLNSGVHFRHSERAGTLVSIYADANSNPLDRDSFRPIPRLVNRFSLTENVTYDLPVEGKNLPPNLACCQAPVAISSDSSRQTSLRQKNPRLQETPPPNGACASHVCYRTINLNSKLPLLQLPTPLQSRMTHIVHQPHTSAIPVSSTTSAVTSEPIRGDTPPECSSTLPSKPLLMLFLSGPGATKLKEVLQRQCYRDRFHLANGQCFRVWIFDAVDPHAVQISPSKWQPHHALHPSPSAPSAFTNLTQNNPSNAINNSGDSNPSSESTADGGSRQRQLKLSLWAMDMAAVEVSRSEKCLPKNVDAVVFRAAADTSPVDEYYDEVGGDFKVELSRAFDLARLLRVPLISIPEKTPPSLLASLLFFAKNLLLFRAVIEKDTSFASIPFLLPEAQSTVSVSLLMQVCSFDADVSLALKEINDGGGVRLEQVGTEEEGKKDEPKKIKVPPLRNDSSASSVVVQNFQTLPRVAIGLDFSNNFAMVPADRLQLVLSPLVVFVTICQALEIFAQISPTVADVRFAVLHFPTPQWPKFCGELTSQLESLLTAASGSLTNREGSSNPDDRQLVLMLVAVSAADSTRPRQLINGLAAQQTCRIWHPRISGPCFPQCLQDEVGQVEGRGTGESQDLSNSATVLKPSLAFLHVQSEGDREFELYRQVLNGDMSSWFLSYSPDYTQTTNSVATVEGRCSRGDNCEMCHGRQLCCQQDSHLRNQQHQTRQHSMSENPPNDLLHRYSPVLAVMHQKESCCAAALAGISDEDYVDAGFHFPSVETAPTEPVQVSFLPVSRPPLFESSTENEKLSEHYAEFNSLLNEAANHQPINSVTRLKRPRRPQAPTLTFSNSPPPPLFHPRLPLHPHHLPPLPRPLLTLSSLITSYTSSSPDRGVIDLRPQRGLFRSCSDTPPICPEKIVGVVSTFTPIPVTLAGGSLSEVLPPEDAYEPVYEEPIQLECQPYKCPTPALGSPGLQMTSTVQTTSSSSNTPPFRRSGRNWLPSGGCFFPPPHTASALKSEFVELMDTLVASTTLVSPSLNRCEGRDTIRSKYGVRRSIPTLIDSRRKNATTSQIYSPHFTQSVSSLSATPVYPAVEEVARETGTKNSNKIFGGLKSAFRRHGSLFRSHIRKNNAKH
ncbi:hypothetical protein TcWFU_002182 [Taenia crassiceps]|uniref:Uncharacterized protein n=1 Tax=Taenia crassiceps TaxID=6207 RepID=A0ABR4QPQ0_9CEST